MALGISTAQTAAPKRTVLRAAHLLDVESGHMLDNQAVVIDADKIVSIGDSAKVSTKDANVIDLGPATLLPGLIDVHTHLTFDPIYGLEALAISVPRQALIGAKNAKLTLEAGFTTVRNVGAEGYTDVALRDSIEAGELPGPHMITAGISLGRTGGHCDFNELPFEYHRYSEAVADGPDEILKRVRQNVKYGATVIKFCATGGVLSKGDDPNASEYTREEMVALVNDAHRLGRKVAAHAHGAQGIVWASEAGVDSIEHGSYIDQAGIDAMKKNGTYLVPQIALSHWIIDNGQKRGIPEYSLAKERAILPVIEANISNAFKAGVKVAYGTDAGVYPHGMNAYEFPAYVAAGLSPIDAIRTATTNAATLLGWSDRVGSIAPGKWADMIAVDGDPAQNVGLLQHVRFVMKSGKVYKNEYAK